MTDKFSDRIVDEAYDRQAGHCGLCGHPLLDGNDKGCSFDAHHINGDPWDTVLENCVLVCREADHNCHLEAHYGDFAGDFVIPRSDYPYLRG